jgi:hypothetical protein
MIALFNLFDTPRKDMEFFNLDNSGLTHDAHPDSKVLPENRVFHLMHKATVDCLSGPHLVSSATNFQIALRRRIDDVPVGDGWTEMLDLYGFLEPLISHATLEAMCGASFLSINPGFVQDFWSFNQSMPRLLQGWPRWLMPATYKARDRCLESMKRFRKLSDDSAGKASTVTKFSGNHMMRARWEYFSKMGGMSEEGIASSDLGILWG